MPTRRTSIPACAPPIGACERARAEADIAHVEDLLWQTAVALEQQGCWPRPRNCASCRPLITAALAAHAPQEVIDELLQRYNEAMQRYMQALAAQSPPASRSSSAADPRRQDPGQNDLQTDC